jgi:hypothetical protein
VADAFILGFPIDPTIWSLSFSKYRPVFRITVAWLPWIVFAATSSADAPELVQTSEQWHGRPVSYLVHFASEGKLQLDASNGFFDQGFRGEGPRPAPADETSLITMNFDYLTLRSGAADATARWHVLLSGPGDLNI